MADERIFLRPDKPLEDMTDDELDEFIEPLYQWTRGLKKSEPEKRDDEKHQSGD